MKNFYVYILECADGIYYTGLTADMERRLNEHQSGINPESYTYKRRPVKLVFFTIVRGYEQASIFEKKSKDWSRAKKKVLIEENWEKLKEAAICMNETSHRFYNKDVSTTLDKAKESKNNVSTTKDKPEDSNNKEL
jgi:putative endonuclease